MDVPARYSSLVDILSHFEAFRSLIYLLSRLDPNFKVNFKFYLRIFGVSVNSIFVRTAVPTFSEEH